MFEAYFDPRKKRKCRSLSTLEAQFSHGLAAEKKAVRRVDLDALEDDAEEEVRCTLMFPLVH